MKRLPLVLLALLITDRPFCQGQNDLERAVVVVRSIDPEDDQFSDLKPLAQRIGNARVVQLGEATHGDGSTFLAKARLIRFLHKVMGFDVLAWEAGFFDLNDLAAGLRSQLPLEEVAGYGLYQMWAKSVEIQPTLAYLRSTQSTTRPMAIVGFDCRVSTPSGRKERFPNFIFSFFERLDPSLILEQEKKDFVFMSEGLVPKDYYDNPGERHYNRDLPRRLVEIIDSRRDALLKVCNDREIDFARQTLVSFMNMDRALPADLEKGTEDGYSRDTAMADNLLWYLNGPLRGHKVIVWAHNYHIMTGNYYSQKPPEFAKQFSGTMGRFLREKLGRDLYTIAFTSYEGEYAFAGEPPEQIAKAAAGSLEDTLHKTGKPYVFLDFASLPSDHPLRKPSSGLFYMYEPVVSNWSSIYDAVFFIDTMKKSNVAPAGGK